MYNTFIMDRNCMSEFVMGRNFQVTSERACLVTPVRSHEADKYKSTKKARAALDSVGILFLYRSFHKIDVFHLSFFNSSFQT